EVRGLGGAGPQLTVHGPAVDAEIAHHAERHDVAAVAGKEHGLQRVAQTLEGRGGHRASSSDAPGRRQRDRTTGGESACGSRSGRRIFGFFGPFSFGPPRAGLPAPPPPLPPPPPAPPPC